jgi:hypothetical protein
MCETDGRPTLEQEPSDPLADAIGRAQLLAVGLISAAILVFEVLLMRLYAIVGWHHFAYMMISIALLGCVFRSIRSRVPTASDRRFRGIRSPRLAAAERV